MSTAASGQLQTQLDKLLKVARDHNAAEIRISSGGKPMLRIKGKFTPVGKRPLSKEQVEGMAAAIMGGNNDATSFLYESPLGVYECGLHDVQGTTMLALKESDKPAAEPAALQQDDMPLELDIQDEEQEETQAASPKNAGSGETFAMPKAAEGTILIDKLLTAAVKNGVSDIHVTAGLPPVFRIDGEMRPQKTKVLTGDDTNGLMKAITPERCQLELAEKGGSDFGFAFGELARFRVSIFKQRQTIAMVLRQIPTKLLTCEQLGVPAVVKQMVERPRGLFLVTGPTGSGKSTTLAALIDHLNESFAHHIITIEDPIEFYHKSKKSTVNQREIGNDVPSFSEALRRALRQDPDIILVGELRDLETIEAAISAAETGHVVFGTLHTTGAQGTINRIIDAFPTNQQEQVRTQLSTAIIGVVSQTLLPKIGGGRVAAYEILVCDSAIGNLIRENKTFRINSSIQTGAKKGMQLLDDNLFRLWNEKKVAKQDVLAKCANPDDLTARIENAEEGIYESLDDDD